MTTPGGATSALGVARLLGRNFPLVLLLVMIGALFWPNRQLPMDEDADIAPMPNGSDEMPSSMRH